MAVATRAAGRAGAGGTATMPRARRRISIVSDDLAGAPDEGIKKFTLALAAALRREHDVALLSTRGPQGPAGVAIIPTSRSFVGRGLRGAIRRQAPEIVIYAARSSATLASFARCRVLRAYAPGATIVLLGLQTRRHGALGRRLIRRLLPDLIGVQSTANGDYLAGLGCPVVVLPSGVDLDLFRPVGPDERRALRAAHGLRPDLPVVLHVGHLEEGRNVRCLGELAARGDCQVVLITSSSTAGQAEHELGRALRRAGVILITAFQPRIEQLFQLADCYAFPVESTDNAIDAPLSVLEALACDTPVVTTRYGGLPRLFAGRDDPALQFVDTPGALVAEAARLAHSGRRGGRALVEPFAWDSIGTRLLESAVATTAGTHEGESIG